MYLEATTTDDLLQQLLKKLLQRPDDVTATRGAAAELIGVVLRLTNPRARLSHTEKKGKVFSSLGEFCWYLSGSNALPPIAYYLPHYQDESDDGETVYGGYGPRLISMRGRINQFQSVIGLLKQCPTSRRAVIQLFDAEDIAGSERHKDIPCTCTWQFFVRDGRLCMATHMRSNDVFLGLSHDLFTFTMIQEIMARTLKLDLGFYTHMVGSLHLYTKHRANAQKYVNEGWQPTKGVTMAPMPMGDPWPAIESLLAAETAIREGQEPAAEALRMDPYWVDLIRLLRVYSLSKKRNFNQIAAIRNQMNSRLFDTFIVNRERSKPTVSAPGQFLTPDTDLSHGKSPE